MAGTPPIALLLACAGLGGCSPNSNWIPTIWGGETLEAALLESDDGCTLSLDAFVVSIRIGALLTPEGTASGVTPAHQLFDLVPPGPQSLASADLSRGVYPEMVYVVGPALEPVGDALIGAGQLIGLDNNESDLNPARGNATAEQRDAMIAAGAEVLIRGVIGCPAPLDLEARSVDVAVPGETGLQRCPLPGFELPGGGFGATTLHVAGERAFEDADGAIALRPLWAAAEGTIEADALEATGLLAPLRERIRGAFAGDAPCVWERVEDE